MNEDFVVPWQAQTGCGNSPNDLEKHAYELMRNAEALMQEAAAKRDAMLSMQGYDPAEKQRGLKQGKKLPKAVAVMQQDREDISKPMRELFLSLEYLFDDVRDNVRRNPKLSGLDTNYAMRRAQAAIEAARKFFQPT